jgi:predicted negative regulator of RcsB-dependent stress response
VARISRHELKHDEFVESVAEATGFVRGHGRTIAIVVGIAVAAAILVFGYRFYAERQSLRAETGLGKAMRTFHATVRAPGGSTLPSDPEEITFPSDSDKYQAALKEFGELAQKFPRTRAARVARYYSALSQFQLGQTDAAMKTLEELGASDDREIASLAKFQMAQYYQRSGKWSEAEKLLRQIIQHPSYSVSKATAELALADQLRERNPAEATKLYEEVRNMYPTTPLADTAKERLDELKR